MPSVSDAAYPQATLVVKAARHLAIDLWRLQTGQTTAEKLGLLLQSNGPLKPGNELRAACGDGTPLAASR
jgi:hypothetical protein